MDSLRDGVGRGKTRINFRHGYDHSREKMSNCSRLAKIRHREGNQIGEKSEGDALQLAIRS